MKTSTDRILTTHVGSLPRPQDVVDCLFAEDRGEPVDLQKFDSVLRRAVADIVVRQAEAGIDVVSDGEMGKISYATYICHRLTGFEGDSPRPTPQDLDDFPEFRDRLVQAGASAKYLRPVCQGPIRVKSLEPLCQDIARFKHALAGAQVTEAFMNSVSRERSRYFSPTNGTRPKEYVGALSEAMRAEYETIVNSGLLLQLDCPDLAMGRHSRFKNSSDAEFLRLAELHVEAMNHALANVPAERVRFHVCWGNYEGPHIHDLPLPTILPIALKAKPMAMLLEGANPRHEHEWEVWKSQKLPADKILIPGVVGTTSNYVEAPELIAQRITRFAELVGRERVMAGTDCGFGTFAGFGPVYPAIGWMKLRSLGQGAALASARLWARAGSAA